MKPFDTTVSSSAIERSFSLYPGVPHASGVAMKRVPIQTPSAPRLSAAARPRPSNNPPAATTGTLSSTMSTIWGTSAIVATVPVCPPASVPWAMTRSQPAATAATACRTFPHMLATRTLLSWQRLTTSRGTPRPATNTRPPLSMMACTCAGISPGAAVRRSTPKGLSVAARTRCICSTMRSRFIVDAPMHPKPPASLTAATSS